MSGPGDILQLVRTGAAVTRSEIVEATGLSRVTVAQRIEALLDAGLIRIAGGSSSTGGRRAARFAFDPRASLVLTTAIDSAHAVVGVVDAHGAVLARDWAEIAVADGPTAVLGRVLDGFDALLDAHGIARTEVGAIGLSAPGPVDPHTHRFNEPPIMTQWNGWPVTETIRERFDVPVSIENDADAMAFGEYAALGADRRPFVLVKASSFLGSGLVIDGRIYRGVDGGAGDIGHVHVGGSRQCRCGRIGCLAAEASGTAIAGALRAEGIDAATARDVARLVEAGEPTAVAAVRRSAELIGGVLATVVGVLNPATIVIAGALSSTLLIAGIRAAVYDGSLPRATRHLDILPPRLGPDAAIIGLAAVATESLFAPDAVDQRLGG